MGSKSNVIINVDTISELSGFAASKPLMFCLENKTFYGWDGNVPFALNDTLGDSSLSGNQVYAVKITPNVGIGGGNNVNCGFFWDNVEHGHFFGDAWVERLGGAEYIVSDGHGGSHALLWGFLGSNAPAKVSGNIWNRATNSLKEFVGIDATNVGELVHLAVGWDGLNIYVYVNGILSGLIPFTGQRGNAGGGEDGILYIGGSDHSNFSGWIYKVRLFENQVPFSAGFPIGYFIPEQDFKTAFHKGDGTITTPQFLIDFTPSKQNAYPDQSNGYKGVRHTGILSYGNDYAEFHQGGVRDRTKFPTVEVRDFEQRAYSGTAPDSPAGWTLFDQFRRRDRVPAWEAYSQVKNNVFAPTGQVWKSGGGLALLSERLMPWANSSTNHWVDSGVPEVGGVCNMDVTFTNGNTEKPMSYLFRGDTTMTNFLYVSTGVNQGLYDIYINRAGSGAGIIHTQSAALTNDTFSTIRIVCTGTNVKVYIDNVLKVDTTITFTAGTYVGVAQNPLCRLEDIKAKEAFGAPSDTTPPSNVTGLTATRVSDSAIDLDWNDATDNVAVTGYIVQRDTDPAFSNPTQINHNSNVSAFSVTGLASDTIYYFRVKATDGANTSVNWSASANAQTDVGAGNQLNWSGYVAPNWTLNPDNSLEATSSTFAGYTPDVISRFNSIGDYIDFTIVALGGTNPLFRFRNSDDSEQFTVYLNGTITSSQPDQYLDGAVEGDVVRIEKISATQFSRSVNGATPQNITKTLTGEVHVILDTLTVDGAIIANPTTNISF